MQTLQSVILPQGEIQSTSLTAASRPLNRLAKVFPPFDHGTCSLYAKKRRGKKEGTREGGGGRRREAEPSRQSSKKIPLRRGAAVLRQRPPCKAKRKKTRARPQRRRRRKKEEKRTEALAKHHQKTQGNNKTTKTKIRSRKWISKTKPKKKTCLPNIFGNKKAQQICKNKGKTVTHWRTRIDLFAQLQ